MKMKYDAQNPRWLALHDWVLENLNYGDSFTVHEWAAAAGVPTGTATADVQAYLSAQRATKHPKGTPGMAFVLSRTGGRTSAARWLVGQRRAEVRNVADMFHEDTVVKMTRAVVRDLEAQGALNPRARQKVEALTHGVLSGAVDMIRVGVNGVL